MIPVLNADLVRALLLGLPIVTLLLALVWRRPNKQRITASFAAFLWCFGSLFILNVIAVKTHWWWFDTAVLTLFGVPIDVVFGWALFWGPAFYLFFENKPLWVPIMVAAFLDIVSMPAMTAFISLSPYWLFGEGVALAVALVPGLMIAKRIEESAPQPA